MTDSIEELKKRADAGDAEAMFKLGLMYAKGEGVTLDIDKAREWWEKAADAGHAVAMFNLGVMYYKGIGVPVDKKEARKWWKKATDTGDTGAMLNLGWMYYEGNTVSVDKDKAKELWEKAADAGNVDAMYNLGVMYDRDKSVPANKKEARKWWEKAADAGNIDAMYNLGVMYDTGDGVTPDKGKAREWLEKAADAGNNMAGISLILRSYVDDHTPFNNLYEAVKKLKNDQHWDNLKKGKKSKIEVCHYTNIEAIRSMLEEKKGQAQPRNILRMYNIGYVNDPLDGKALVKHSEDTDGLLHEFFRKEKEKDEDEDDEPLSKYVYFASFTGAKDRLDLWRAYGRDGAGCCIVIPVAEFAEEPKGLAEGYIQIRASIAMESKTEMTGARLEAGTEEEKSPEHPRLCLYRVLYEKKELDAALNSLKEHLKEIKNIKDKIEMPDEEETKIARKKIDEVVRIILSDILYLYKNEEYKTENELRMLSIHHDSDSSILIEEEKRETGMRHLFIETQPFLFKKPGYEIIIGPKVTDPYAAQREIEHLLHKRNFAESVKVRLSAVPYR